MYIKSPIEKLIPENSAICQFFFQSKSCEKKRTAKSSFDNRKNNKNWATKMIAQDLEFGIVFFLVSTRNFFIKTDTLTF